MPGVTAAASGGTARTETIRLPSAVIGASAFSTSSGPGDPAQINVIAK